MKSLRFACVCLMAGGFFVSALAQLPPPLRIMPLGDSITAGSIGGYRDPLYHSLSNLGYNVDFVGTLKVAGTNSLPDWDHEGHSGWKIAGIDGGIGDWLKVLDDPDVILLHIGTNDSGREDFTNAIDELDALITNIATSRPYAHLIVTTLLERDDSNGRYTAITNHFNPYVSGTVSNQVELGRRVTFLDMNAYVPLSDMPDGLHPNQDGYDKMAAAWMPAITNLVSPVGDGSAPGLYRARGSTNHHEVAVTFSKAVDPATATNTSNYGISGLTIAGATLSADQRTVTLTTSQQTRGTEYTVTVNNVTDLSSPSPLAIAADSTVSFTGAYLRGYLNNVAESEDYTLVYALDIPTVNSYRTNYVDYAVDNSLLIGEAFSRVAYYMELQVTDGPLRYVWASMDAFTNNAAALGVPTLHSGVILQRPVGNLFIDSNEPGVTSGSGYDGNLEFWPYNYSSNNSAGVVGASNTTYDFGDRWYYTAGASYGSMQVHNTTLGMTLFAFNSWGGANGIADIGIGNCPSPVKNGVDWTFSANADNYTVRSLYVLVKRVPDAVPPTVLSAQAGTAGTLVTVTFSEGLMADSLAASGFSLDNGVSVHSATLCSDLRTVTLVTTPQPAGVTLTLTVNGVRDLTGANTVAPDTAVTVDSPALPPEIVANAGSLASGYELVYTLDIPARSTISGPVVPYRYDQRFATGSYDRVAYYVELEKWDATVQYVWVSMDAFSYSRSMIGVPTSASQAIFQEYVTRMDVLSNVEGVSNGTDIATGNIEFWPQGYSYGNAKGIPDASATLGDWGDTRSASGTHGSMQVHNYGAKQTVFGLSNWGTPNAILGLGIGNQPIVDPDKTTHPDWTWSSNADTYARRVLHVLVRPAPHPLPALPEDVSANVPGAAGYHLAVSITNIPIRGLYTNDAFVTATYAVDNRRKLPPFTRIAYYLELQKKTETTTQFVWTATDAFTTDPMKIAVPVPGTLFQHTLTNLDVFSNVGGIVNGNGMTTGNIEFWPSSYSQTNTLAIPGASNSTYDFGDSLGVATTVGFGSMQIHNYGASQTLFAMNNFNNNAYINLGIGSQPTGHPDWTQTSYNASNYTRRVMHVFVLPGGDGDPNRDGPKLIGASGSRTFERLLLTFDRELADTAANPANFSISGVDVLRGELLPGYREITLTTTAQTPGQTYTVSVTGVRDRTSNGNLVAPGTSATFAAPPAALPTVLSGVSEAGDYTLVQQLAVPNRTYFASTAVPYSVDESYNLMRQAFDRVAYCLELTGTNGVAQWAYVSVEAFTNSSAALGVPVTARGATYQRFVTNMNVYASANANVTTGTGIDTGNMEFWASNYSATNALGVPGASSSFNDFGDSIGTTLAGHGSMQVHNYGAAQTIFAYNSFGSDNRGADLGVGNRPGSSVTDWTGAQNVLAYSVKNLYVLIRLGGAVSGSLPDILSDPVACTVLSGERAVFAVQAAGAAAYQWRCRGVPIPGATRSLLEINPAKVDDAGDYDVLVYGTGTAYALSTPATLTVIPLGTLMRLK